MTMPANGAQWKGEGIFGKGLLYSSTEEPQYIVRGQRRDKDGTVEVHAQDTDIIIFMDGSATFVTGGSVVDQKTLRPYQLSGSAIRDGVTHQVSRGDVVIVPKGTSHWFQKVNGSVGYFALTVHEPDTPAESPSTTVSWKRSEAFAKGGLLYDGKGSHPYQLYAVERKGPGTPEIHEIETDIVFFLDGSATWVVGGTPEGKTLTGGEPRMAAKDDVVIVPHKVQHWFSKVNGNVQYYAVKIISR